MKFDVNALQWTRQPESSAISQDRIEIVTKPHTDLWQRTYYHSGTITPRCCRCPPKNNSFPLW